MEAKDIQVGGKVGVPVTIFDNEKVSHITLDGLVLVALYFKDTAIISYYNPIDRRIEKKEIKFSQLITPYPLTT